MFINKVSGTSESPRISVYPPGREGPLCIRLQRKPMGTPPSHVCTRVVPSQLFVFALRGTLCRRRWPRKGLSASQAFIRLHEGSRSGSMPLSTLSRTLNATAIGYSS